MDGARFFASLCNIVGEDSARRYTDRFGPLDQPFTDNLLNYEGLAFYAYSTELNWHRHINNELWSVNPSLDVLIFAKVLNTALSKLTPYVMNGRVAYRGYSSSNLPVFMRNYAIGASVLFHGFTSASFHEHLAFGGNVLFIIRTLTGRAIWHLAANYEEFEVLIPSGRTFVVSDIEYRQDKAVIYLDELP